MQRWAVSGKGRVGLLEGERVGGVLFRRGFVRRAGWEVWCRFMCAFEEEVEEEGDEGNVIV